jgi:hypothetical protein
MFPQNLPDRGRMELHNADQERRMRQIEAKGLFGQFLMMLGICAAVVAVLFVITRFI